MIVLKQTIKQIGVGILLVAGTLLLAKLAAYTWWYFEIGV